ncbi:hypothetical protein IG197_24270 [Aminobacter sp. SR38]|jgi:formiminotetrahydrofolate cyclodeaminase|uniref:hypothetical protein n=1 Tax=Aminobacter sp. SR38 TaxID=2774562 RepID=UPI00177C22E5|nr:hypothetical protein [Aminobacter sp. SR38]QOF70868.1 hypothetical protein IG197_24270 [Aminobacter sp. SR38]
MENNLQNANQSQSHLNKAFRTDSRYFDKQVDAWKIPEHDLGYELEWAMSFTERGETA